MNTRHALMSVAVVASLAGPCATVAAGATGGSLVYIRDANVWLANPDGSGAVQVTTDGTPALPYRSVSQSDAGVILALRGAPGQPYRFLRLAQNGTLLAPAFEAGTPTPPSGAEVSPDGSLLAYSFTTDCEPGPAIVLCSRVVFSRADAFTDTNTIDDGTYDNLEPSWIDDHTIIAANQAEVWFDPVGPPQEAKWWADGEALNDPPVTFENPPAQPGRAGPQPHRRQPGGGVRRSQGEAADPHHKTGPRRRCPPHGVRSAAPWASSVSPRGTPTAPALPGWRTTECTWRASATWPPAPTRVADW